MNNEKLLICPSEAFLLGFCWGEYTRMERKEGEESEKFTFLNEIQQRIDPFTFSLVREVDVELPAFPTDVEWLVFNHDDSPCSGRSASYPNGIIQIIYSFRDDEKRIYYTTWDFSRRSFFDILVLKLWKYFAPTYHQMAHFGPDIQSRINGSFPENSDDQTSHRSVGSEKWDEISRIINDVVNANELTQLFSLGQMFGEAIAAYDNMDVAWQPFVPSDQPSGVDVDRAGGYAAGYEIGNEVTRLLKHPVIRLFPLVETSFERLQCDLGTRGQPSRRNSRDDVHMILWSAFGQILAYYREEDFDFHMTDAEAITSRTNPFAFQLGPNDTPDEILQQLAKAERDFNSDPNPMPVLLLRQVVPLIESLAKRIEPEKSRLIDYKNYTVRSVLEDLKKYGNSTEKQRFGAIGLTLYIQYRGMVSHPEAEEKFRCILEEARFVLAGLRMMVSLWREIGATTK